LNQVHAVYKRPTAKKEELCQQFPFASINFDPLHVIIARQAGQFT
jgi:hypothetical protein